MIDLNSRTSIHPDYCIIKRTAELIYNMKACGKKSHASFKETDMDIRELIGKKMLYFDGGLGTLLQAAGLQPGEEPERWNIEHADVVKNVHLDYYKAGCNIVTTDTLGGSLTVK